ncbi:wax ester/triacylglycerol synthase domain-containing protein [Aliiglaciecola sp. LCG003]|uniref:wax ester/triacylglycerol synthase domain-containing protein n=1 Tax=Aliiglaciecola sp. LCG003 TaxID=3053655 RepID=UPI002572C3EC|nr:wax ester/triacylglycerol synthase domain-containing protein [Aliiglaciecola sp. LCG003]WJG08191.1 wax ester/triacylglycerol synthase family O-acyltransferase [Aliiglaciecola sp. LCG003]
MSNNITFLDKTFWITESEDNPKHVASLQLLEMPDGAAPDYVEQLCQEVRQFDHANSPFNGVVKCVLGFPTKLIALDKLDMQYHVQLHEVEDVTDRESLHVLTAKLHETWLDRDKPLWQYHFIRDNKSTQFAIYAKVHHMYGDGATLIRWFQAGYLDHPTTEGFVPVWASDRPKRKERKQGLVKSIMLGAFEFVMVILDMLFIFLRLLMKLTYINPVYMPIPFSGTKTLLTGQVKKGRVVSTVDLDFDRIKALSRRARASANEILLCSFDIGVHRFLKDHGHTFKKALYTNMPINLRKPGEQTGGNKIAIVPVRLAHGKNDPYLRLRQIIENHRIVKWAAKRSRPAAFSYYTLLIQSYGLIFEMLRLSDFVRPIANILISNVPGPSNQRYLKDSKLLSCYPISTMTPGGGVNITLITYAGVANVGIVCCDKNVKSLEPLSLYFVEAFEMLEKCIDDPSLNIDDIGEKVREDNLSIVDDIVFHEENSCDPIEKVNKREQ